MKAIVSDLQTKWHSDLITLLPPGHSPTPDAQKLYNRALELVARVNRRDLETAVGLMRSALDIDPHFTTALGTLAFALWVQADSYGESERLPLAMFTAKKALAIDPYSVQAHRVIASCYLKESRPGDALEELLVALEIDPQSVGCCQSLGLCLRDMGQPHRSIPWLVRATEIDPSRGACYSALAESLAICGYDQRAEAALAHTIQLDGEQPESLIDLSVLRTWQRKFGEARQLCLKARQQCPDTRFGLSLTAWIEFCDGNGSDAETCFKKLRSDNTYQQNWEFFGAINPTSALAYLTFKSGALDQARSLADEAVSSDVTLLKLYPNNARILHDLAATRSLMGDTDKAFEYLEKAIAAGWAEDRSSEIDPRFSAIASTPRFQELLKSRLEKFF